MREIKSKLAKFSPFFQSAVVVLIASLFVMSVVYAATTIGSDITTAGLLTVTGRATTTSATTTNYLMVGDSLTVPDGFDYDADLTVSDDVLVGGTVTTTAALWVGTGVANNLNLAGGDLYVQGNAEFDSLAYFSTATITSATTTNYLMVGDSLTVPDGFDYDADLTVSDDVLVGGTVTTTAALWVGTGVADSLNLAGGDLYVQDDVEVDGDVVVSGSSFDLASATATVTPGIFSRDETTGTSTVSIGDITTGAVKKQVGCLELAANDGAYYSCFINVGTSALVCYAGRCN